ncbi:hypothetical protein AYI68_g7019 [Smittium mucronatum]|uniref:Uncharacterized protein n=1 Tax=Smittium mucronatum TaxID=133383 RepID=A0A1R0GPV1_9FUNG|nr:hypothetical protein AYI68_g7019 [Smittium mucronatum]
MSPRAAAQKAKVLIPKEVIPIVGFVGLAAAMAGYHVYHKLSGNDIVLNRKNPFPFLNSDKDFNPSYIKITEKDVYHKP